MTSALSPRDIQTRIRAGASLEELSRESEVPLERIEPFAAPVLAEREHVAATALQCPVRRRGETGSVRAMRAVVTEALAARAIDFDDVEWDSWRNEDRRWTIVGRYVAGDEQHEALFLFDQRARFSVASNDQARWLIGEHTSLPSPAPVATVESPDAEPTIDLSDELALVRAIQGPGDEETAPRPAGAVVPDETSPTQRASAAPAPSSPAASGNRAVEPPTVQEVLAERERVVFREVRPADGDEPEVADYAPAELEQVDGVYDIVPTTTNDMDVLYDMLSSFAEDSVNIYAGLTNPVAPHGEEGGEEGPDQDGPAPTGLHLVPDTGASESGSSTDDDASRAGGSLSPTQEAAPADGVTADTSTGDISAEASGAIDDWAAGVSAQSADSARTTTANGERAQGAPDSASAQGGPDDQAAEPVIFAVEDAEPSTPPVQVPSSVAAQIRSNDEMVQRRHQAQDHAVPDGVATGRTASSTTAEDIEASISGDLVHRSAPDETITTLQDGAPSAMTATQQAAVTATSPAAPAEASGIPSPAEIAARAAAVDTEPMIAPNPAEVFLQPETTAKNSSERPSRDPEIAQAETSPDPEPSAPTGDAAGATGWAPRNGGTGVSKPELEETQIPDAAPTQQEAGKPEQPKAKPRAKKKRASVPSWDEIMFGGPTPGTH